MGGQQGFLLLRTARGSLTQLTPTRFEFDASHKANFVLGVMLILGAWGVAGVCVAALVFAVASGELDPGLALFCVAGSLIFTLGGVLGVASLILFRRRCGVFVLDVANKTLERNGQMVARPGEIARARVGVPSMFGVIRASLPGPRGLEV